jgi:hypothetical protein
VAACATHDYIAASVVPDDLVLFRGGAHTNDVNIRSGSAGKPVIYLGYPGETVTHTVSSSTTNFNTIDDAHYVIDGFRLSGGAGCISGGTDEALSLVPLATDIMIRNIETVGYCGIGGVAMFYGLSYITLEYSVLHGNTGGSHGAYWGSQRDPNSHATFRNNLSYLNGINGLTMNGRCNYCNIESNVSWGNDVSGITIENGFASGRVTKNLLLNNASNQFVIYNYHTGSCTSQGGTGALCIYPQINNLFDHNTIYVGGGSPFPTDNGGFTSNTNRRNAIVVATSDTLVDDPNDPKEMGHNTYSNNILVSYDSAIAPVYMLEGDTVRCATRCLSWLSTSTFTNNLHYRSDGSGAQGVLMIYRVGQPDYEQLTCLQSATYTTVTNCNVANPLFTSASTANWAKTPLYDFHFGSGSPAYHAGTGSETYDLNGAAFNATPSLGALEALTSTPVAPTITTSSPLPAGTVGSAYSQTITATGDATITFSVTSGTLPAGLSLASNGALTGTPTTAGASTFTVTATNGVSPDDADSFSLTINAAVTNSHTRYSGAGRTSGAGRVIQ